ncbi:hypothetical protein EV702DRAFT_149208 [Suillus placidus]|uniref:Uncharacterized protein n=1 Tax=Suillus placidus TaxID=48579 RepID=A0A9P6ZFJ6_9AGAM|nr:hypothetical protein EV702DRAFT_149208 [Suillus placidus]
MMGLNGTSLILTLDASDSPPSNNTRTLWNIIWSCGVTLFACAWTAIHPNIPGMDEKRLAIFFRRILIMIMVLIAPELILIWAFLQRSSAIAVKKQFNDALGARPAEAHDHHPHPDIELPTLRSGFPESNGSSSAYRPAEFKEWTMTHGFFAWMGGFMLYVDREPRATLTPDELLRFVREESVDMPVIQKADIEDRSKGDIFSKGVAIFQLAWFVLQFAARRAQNLPITLLEIDTLAIVALTFSAYLLWWTKPKDVGRPYIVHWKSTALPPSKLTYDEPDPRFSHAGCSGYLFYLVYPCISAMGMGTIMSRHAAQSRRVPSLGGYGGSRNITIVSDIMRRDDMAGQPTAAPVDRETDSISNSRRTTTLSFEQRSEFMAFGIGSYSGGLLGGIHCLGWNFLFQRHAELILWRAASIVMACAPSFVMEGLILRRLQKSSSVEKYFFSVAAAFLYISARIIIFVLMMLSFRSLPPGVYDTVDWTIFVPHL